MKQTCLNYYETHKRVIRFCVIPQTMSQIMKT